MKNIYKIALKNKFRFQFRGQIGTEDLFDLSLTDLDTIYKSLNKQVKVAEEDSLLSTKTKAEEDLLLKLDIVKEIFTDKQDEIQKKKEEKATKEKNQYILSLIEKKENEALEGLSVEELRGMLK